MTCARRGFTLIEVVGAVLVFAVGVLMVIGLSRALGEQMEISAVSTMVTVDVQERMDSLAALPYASLPVSTKTSYDTLRGIPYTRSVVITQFSPLLRQISVSLQPSTGPGPRRSSTTYVSNRW